MTERKCKNCSRKLEGLEAFVDELDTCYYCMLVRKYYRHGK